MSRYYRTILNVQATAIDPDAQAFLTATGITDATITSAINNLVVSLKTDGLWAKMKAVYPFVGGTDATHKFNLKDPRDLDAAFRITWFGGVTHSANGVQGNGTNGYGNTHLLRSVLNVNSTTACLYSRTNVNVSAYDLGAFGASPNFNGTHMWIRGSGSFFRNQSNAGLTALTFASSQGFFANLRENSLTVKIVSNTTVDSYILASSAVLNDNSFFILGTNSNGTLASPSTRQYAMFAFGDGMNESDILNFRAINLTFQTALSRNV